MLKHSMRLMAFVVLLYGMCTAVYAVQGQLAPQQISDGFIVKFKNNVSRASQSNTLVTAGLQSVERFSLVSGLTHVQAVAGQNTQNALGILAQNNTIEYVEPNYLVRVERVPNDPDYVRQYALDNQGQSGGLNNADIDAPQAWDTTTGQDVVVAIIDSGVDYNHQDLVNNIWINENEIPGNGIDDDNNGFIDDVRGWDFANNDNDPMDDHSHGTHVAGIIAAEGDNNIGVTGVNWHARIMALKFIDAGGIGSTVNAIRAINYAVANGARISNNSWGGAGYSQALFDTLQAALQAGHVAITAAGNESINSDDPNTPHYPSGYDLNNVIAVTATDNSDTIAGFANYGNRTVDLGAPGVRIFSSIPGNNYQFMDGTSMAAPYVTGVAALILSRVPNISVDSLRSALLSTVDPVPSLSGITVTGGRLNASKALAAVTADIHISPNTLSLGVNQTQQFSAQGGLAPYQWSVSNSSLAQIDSSGFFKALAPGRVQVVVTDANSFRSTSGDITISNINLTPQNSEALVGDVIQFSASGGIVPYSWSTPPNGVGEIDVNTGLFTALSQGVTQVTVRDSGGLTKTSGSIQVIAAQNLILTPMRADMLPGETLTFNVSGGVPPYAWQVSNTNVASIDMDGNLTAENPGSIRVTIMDANGTLGRSEVILVTESTALGLFIRDRVVGLNKSTSIRVSGGVPPYQWNNSNPSVLQLDSTAGVVKGIGIGTATITVIDGQGETVVSDVLEVRQLNISPMNYVLEAGQSLNYSVSGGAAPYHWKSSNLSVASVNTNGLVTAVTAGMTNIVVTDNDGIQTQTELNVITVGSGANHPMDIRPNNAILSRRSTNVLQFTVSGGMAPYTFGLSNPLGSINSRTGEYSPMSPTTGETHIIVTDADGHTAQSGVISVQ